ncbi:MAG: NAD(P)H-quinone oxidoreductase [Candidatus Obscuribacterales bacterium]|nr:NAD(P)H-quinone oxidoreductase [Candidatus Obscuribacterales bacterium]
MKAIVITKPGGPEVLKYDNVPTPEPQGNEVRIAVKATAVNQADILQRRGQYPAPPTCPADIPGLEYSGVIEKIGPDVKELAIGQNVFGLVAGGSYAEFIITDARTVAPMPSNLSFEEAAAIPEAYITAYDAMVSQCKLAAGETVLINAVGSGVGSAAVQIASVIGATSIGSSRTAEKLEPAIKLGLNKGILVKDKSLSKLVLEATNNKGVDVVLELVGGDYVTEDVACMTYKGRIVVVGLLAGAKADLNLAALLSKRLQIRGTTLRARPLEEKIEVNKTFIRELVPHIADGCLKPVIDCIMNLDQAAKAHEYVSSGDHFGKVVLKV